MSDADPDEITGMQTGSEAGAPGEHLPEPPLSPDEQRLLADLQRPAEGKPITAVEDTPAMAQAVEDDSPLPAAGGDTEDPDNPVFAPPS
jgi:hypothetical protein